MSSPYIANTNQSEETTSHLPDWREILAILIERMWIGIAVAAVVFAGFFIQLKRTVPYYRSTAVLMVDLQARPILNYQDILMHNRANLEYFNTVVKTLYSRSMLEKAVQDERLAANPDFFPNRLTVAEKAAAAQRFLTIEPVEKSRLIHVTVEHPDPQIASDLANAVARAYIQQQLENRMSASLEAIDWLQDKSEEYRNKLDEGLLALQKYREQNESVSLEEDQNIVIAKLKTLNAALTESQTELIGVRSRRNAVQEQIQKGIPLEELAVQLDDEGLTEALMHLRQQRRKVAQLQQRYKEGWPELQEAVKIEQDLTARLQEACDLAVVALERRYEALVSREEGLQEALKTQEQLSFSLARQLIRYDDLKRNIEADQEIYNAMLEKMKETSISETLPSEMIRLAEEARPAGRPFRPVPVKVLSRGLLLGVVLGLMAIFLLHYMDQRLRRDDEVERLLGVPVLTSLPFIEGESVSERGIYCHLHKTGEVPEAFRTLRTVLQVKPSLKNTQVFLITSTQPGEGKSLVATNLAICFAQDDRKTLLIGADLRRPAYKSTFNVDHMPPGLSEVLKGSASWREVINAELIPGLDILPPGRIPDRPAELIGNSVLDGVMAEIREEYDQVVIDCSPLMGISDALLMMEYADGVLFVVRQGITHRLGARHAMRRIQETDTPCIGALLNGVNLKSLSNYYYYRRYGGYEYRQYYMKPETSDRA
ncbi:MAG TPA: polysaccharide biosynthesis tyrosine autokinase [Tichowtungia sp.]|nr:polysaccharide biosynthesis tyrosine autokinase [Tichowtungia sp.]